MAFYNWHVLIQQFTKEKESESKYQGNGYKTTRVWLQKP